MTQSRLDRIISILNESELDALVLNPGASLYYLSGFHFHLMERPIVLFIPRSGTPALVRPAGLLVSKVSTSIISPDAILSAGFASDQ